jgi:hypothetical protein
MALQSFRIPSRVGLVMPRLPALLTRHRCCDRNCCEFHGEASIGARMASRAHMCHALRTSVRRLIKARGFFASESSSMMAGALLSIRWRSRCWLHVGHWRDHIPWTGVETMAIFDAYDIGRPGCELKVVIVKQLRASRGRP